MSIFTELWAQLFESPTNWVLFFGTITGAGSVFALAKNKAKTGWVLGIINAILFIFVMYEYGLYADVALNVYYFMTCIFGLIWWLYGGTRRQKGKLPDRVEAAPLRVSRLTNHNWVAIAIAWVIGTLALAIPIMHYTDVTGAVAYVDSFTTAGSLIAQFLLARKILENWYIWIFVDVIDIGLYLYKGLPAVALMTVVYMAFCIIGLRKFMALEREETQSHVEILANESRIVKVGDSDQLS